MTKTILLADDSATIRKIVELTFLESGYQVESVASGAAALERLDEIQPDVVLADVTMPDPGGYELCRRIKESGRVVPVLLLAGTFEPFDDQLAERCAADGHLVKPFESATLIRKIEMLLESTPRTLEPEPQSAKPATSATGDVPAGPGDAVGSRLGPADVKAIAREVVRLIGDDVIREIASTAVPEAADRVVRERIRELERGEDGHAADNRKPSSED